MLTRALLQRGASPNAKLRYCEIPAWDGCHWTAWTVTLLSLAGLIRKGELLDGTLLDLVELFLTHGADPTVCFVGRYLPKRKLKPVPVYRLGPEVYAAMPAKDHVQSMFDEEHDGWYYLTLA